VDKSAAPNKSIGYPQVSGSIPADVYVQYINRPESESNNTELKSIWTRANRPSSKGSKLVFPIVKANEIICEACVHTMYVLYSTNIRKYPLATNLD